MNNITPEIIKNATKKLDKLRTELGYSIRTLSEKSGVSKSTIHYVLQGKMVGNIYTLYYLCEAVGITLSDLFNEDEKIIELKGKENLLVKIYNELSPMSQDTLIKVAKCMK